MIAVLADGAVFDFCFAVVNQNIRSVRNEFAVEETAVECGFAAAIADGFDFLDFVRNLKQARRAFEAAVFEAEV